MPPPAPNHPRNRALHGLCAALAAALAGHLGGCSSDTGSLAPEERAREPVGTILRAENPNTNEYTVAVRRDPSAAVQTLADIPMEMTGDLALAPDGSLWTVTQDAMNAKILRISSGGSVETFLEGFQDLRGIARDSQGRLYVTSFANATVERVDADSMVTPILGGLTGASGVALDPSGTWIYVAASLDDLIHRIRISDGSSEVLALSSTVFAPHALTFDAAGALYVSSDASPMIVKIDVSGAAPPGGYAVNPVGAIPETFVGTVHHANGTLYVGTDSQILTMADDGTVSLVSGSLVRGRRNADPGSLAQFRDVFGIAVGPGGTLFVSDSGPGDSGIRTVTPSQSIETGTWESEFADTDAFLVEITAWTFGKVTGDSIPVVASNTGASSGSLAVGLTADRLAVFGLIEHDVWIRLEVFRFL